MKKLAFSAALVALLIPGIASAAPYGMAGCGLGSLVFGDDAGMIQLLAGTTNGTFASQTFGITSGTSNCVEASGSASIDQKAFIQVNYANLVRDAAEGQGEYLSAFATLLGCHATVHEDFFSLTQTQHEAIFTPEMAPTEALTKIKGIMAKDQLLASQCKRI